MSILNIAGYKFVALSDLERLRQLFLRKCEALSLKGTILLSAEGINLSLAGDPAAIDAFKGYLQEQACFAGMTFRESYSETQPFRLMKVKLKAEIITMRQPAVDAVAAQAPHLSPEEFKKWLDEGRDMTVLDTRNDYEVRFGTFAGAVNLHLQQFSEFPAAIDTIDKNKPIVMFCTGGVRCEKAAIHMQNQGFSEVYQLEGGILNYFARVGGAHYQGECFVFDDRIAVDPHLACLGTVQCEVCQGPVTIEQQQSPAFIINGSCPACV